VTLEEERKKWVELVEKAATRGNTAGFKQGERAGRLEALRWARDEAREKQRRYTGCSAADMAEDIADECDAEIARLEGDQDR
jgi:hypothetical protein